MSNSDSTITSRWCNGRSHFYDVIDLPVGRQTKYELCTRKSLKSKDKRKIGKTELGNIVISLSFCYVTKSNELIQIHDIIHLTWNSQVEYYLHIALWQNHWAFVMWNSFIIDSEKKTILLEVNLLTECTWYYIILIQISIILQRSSRIKPLSFTFW